MYLTWSTIMGRMNTSSIYKIQDRPEVFFLERNRPEVPTTKIHMLPLVFSGNQSKTPHQQSKVQSLRGGQKILRGEGKTGQEHAERPKQGDTSRTQPHGHY